MLIVTWKITGSGSTGHRAVWKAAWHTQKRIAMDQGMSPAVRMEASRLGERLMASRQAIISFGSSVSSVFSIKGLDLLVRGDGGAGNYGIADRHR